MWNNHEEELLKLAGRARRLYRASVTDPRTRAYVVQPAMPILYFGNLPEYKKSDLRVVTLGINPSEEEFPRDDRLKRFPRAKFPDKDLLPVYLSFLNKYFDPNRCPHRWFDAYEHKLDQLCASYYKGRPNRAIHTDYQSPLATRPGWSLLKARGKEEVLSTLAEAGSLLWMDLAAFLSPCVIVTTIQRKYVRDITERFAPSECLQEYSQNRRFGCDEITINRKKAYLVKVNCLPAGQPSPKSLDRAFKWLEPKL